MALLEQLPQVLGAAASFMLGWAACDWLRTRQARKEGESSRLNETESAAGEAKPINSGALEVTKVNTSVPSQEGNVSPACHNDSIDANGDEESPHTSAPDGMVEGIAEAKQPESVQAREPRGEPRLTDQPVMRAPSVRVLDCLIAADSAD